MLTYNPERFASLYASALGQRLWDFLTQPENVARLETASELSKPAVARPCCINHRTSAEYPYP